MFPRKLWNFRRVLSVFGDDSRHFVMENHPRNLRHQAGAVQNAGLRGCLNFVLCLTGMGQEVLPSLPYFEESRFISYSRVPPRIPGFWLIICVENSWFQKDMWTITYLYVYNFHIIKSMEQKQNFLACDILSSRNAILGAVYGLWGKFTPLHRFDSCPSSKMP